MSSPPRLSIGFPVYNGQTFMSESLDALLGQTFTDFELIISDNASTDATAEICHRYAEQDSRVHYVRQPRNIGSAPNHNFVVQQARGELFKWASHDDLYGPKLLARCVDALDSRPEVVLSHADMAIVDESGQVRSEYVYRLATGSPEAPRRFRSLLLTEGGDDIYGVIRTEVLRRIAPVGSYHNSGRKLVAELSLYGPFHQVKELMYFRRDHGGRGDRRGSVQAVCTNLDPRREGQSTARLIGEYLLSYLVAIQRAPLSTKDRLRCYQYVMEWVSSRALRRQARSAA